MATGIDAATYSASSARVKGLYARLLTKEAWRELVVTEGLSPTLEILKPGPYGDVVDAVGQTGRLSLETLERHLEGRSAANIRKAMTFSGGPVRHLLLVWWQHFELENLKALFRGLDQGMDPNTIRHFLIPLGESSTLPWDTLLHEHSMSSLIARLSDTHYINPLRAAFSAYEREHNLFRIEIALDIRYYRDLAAAIVRLRGDERKDAQRILGTHLDILNILWAYRYRIYHKLSAEEIVNYTLWNTIRTDANLIRSIALGAPAADILVQVWGPDAFDPASLAELDDTAQMMPRLEFMLQQFWGTIAEREMGGYPFKLGTLLGYLVLEELEIQDLITLLEGKGMGWEPERITQYLVRYSKE